MPIDRFTKEEFEAALPVHQESGQVLWSCRGCVGGEFVYDVSTAIPELVIRVRSSVGPDGMAADSGEDSIRVWLCHTDGTPWGSKTQRWVTRMPGWADRLKTLLREQYKVVLLIKRHKCPTCGWPKLFKCKTEKNMGRLFIACTGGDDNGCKKKVFEWVEGWL